MQHNNLQDKGVVEVASFASTLASLPERKCTKDGSFASKEPISVLDTRSPSPSTSSSTPSSSFGGTNGEKLANLLVACKKNERKRKVGLECTSPAAASDGGDCNPEEEFAVELQAVTAGLEVNRRGTERLNFGLEDWEGFLSESSGWVSGDSEGSALGLKQLLQGGNPYQVDGNADFVSGFQGLGSDGSVSAGDVMINSNNSPGFLVSEISMFSNNGKLGSVPCYVGLGNNTGNPQKQDFSSSPSISQCLARQSSSIAYHPQLHCELKSEIVHTQGLVNQFQVPNTRNLGLLDSVLCGAGSEQPQPKRHNPGLLDSNLVSQVPRGPFLDPGNKLLLKKSQNFPQLPEIQVALGSQLNLLTYPYPQPKPLLLPKQEVVEGSSNLILASLNQQQQQEVVYDQLYEAIELILTGNFSQAQEILARLNHQLSPCSPFVTPFHRSAFYVKEALQLSLLMPNPAFPQSLRVPSLVDSMFKMGAYKMLSDISPLVQFKNFTTNQAFLEVLGNEESIHIVDFDIGIGAQWSSLMQELPGRNKGLASLKITAFASPSTHHPFEITLMHESLTQFATDVGISFQLEVVNFDTFEPSAFAVSSFRSSEKEAVAVNLPVWSTSGRPSLIPSLLCFIRQLSPKAVVLLDRGCERYDLPPSCHLLHNLQYYEVLLDSIDAANVTPDSVNKIERFLFQPEIESIVCGRLHSPNIMPPTANLLASAGFSSIAISCFSEAQAEWMVRRAQVKGFTLEKRRTSLVLCWQHKELLSVSVWKC